MFFNTVVWVLVGEQTALAHGTPEKKTYLSPTLLCPELSWGYLLLVEPKGVPWWLSMGQPTRHRTECIKRQSASRETNGIAQAHVLTMYVQGSLLRSWGKMIKGNVSALEELREVNS